MCVLLCPQGSLPWDTEKHHTKERISSGVFLPHRFAILTPCIKDSFLTPGSQRVITHTQTPVREMFSASSFLPTTILQLKTLQVHKNTIKSAIVAHDNSTMLLPHCNANFLPVNTIQPRRVKMKSSNLQQPLSRDRGDHPTTKYTTFDTEMLHIQEHQPVVTFERENSNPCKPALDVGLRHLSQQHSDIQPNTTPRQQGRFTSARFLTKKHQSGPIAQQGKQHHGQTNNMYGNTTMQKHGHSTTKKYTLTISSSGRPIGLTNRINCRLHSQTMGSLPKREIFAVTNISRHWTAVQKFLLPLSCHRSSRSPLYMPHLRHIKSASTGTCSDPLRTSRPFITHKHRYIFIHQLDYGVWTYRQRLRLMTSTMRTSSCLPVKWTPQTNDRRLTTQLRRKSPRLLPTRQRQSFRLNTMRNSSRLTATTPFSTTWFSRNQAWSRWINQAWLWIPKSGNQSLTTRKRR